MRKYDGRQSGCERIKIETYILRYVLLDLLKWETFESRKQLALSVAG